MVLRVPSHRERVAIENVTPDVERGRFALEVYAHSQLVDLGGYIKTARREHKDTMPPELVPVFDAVIERLDREDRPYMPPDAEWRELSESADFPDAAQDDTGASLTLQRSLRE